MAQRILEPGQIETLAQRSIIRVRLPGRDTLFARRAARLRELATRGAAIGDYLRFLAALVDAQHAALARTSAVPPDAAHIDRAGAHGMPPIHSSTWPRPPQWRAALELICSLLASQPGFPAGVREVLARIRGAAPEWTEAQADAVLGEDQGAADLAAAPFIMAALQVQWAALAGCFIAEQVRPLDVPGVCPLCGTLPVASMVYAQPSYQGYRYLHCALCATEWHLVRVQCSRCGASGQDISYHSLADAEGDAGAPVGASAGVGASGGAGTRAAVEAAVRAETCEQCRGYRKILYQEKDTGVEPVADDVASVALDLLLGEQGYHRASGNPLLWQPTAI
jgi:FdhE protein